ncbi:MAG TPA: C25 family cysteine peptidase, partial [Acidobacteriota bacterium]
MLLPLSAQAQEEGIGFDTATSADTGTGTASSLTFSLTVGSSGNGRLLIVGVSIRNSGSQTVSSVTYNGVNLTQVGARSNSAHARIEIWRLVAPATGANNVVVTMSAAARFVAGAASFTGVNQTTPVGTFFSNIGSNSTPSVNVTGVLEGEVIIDTLANRYLGGWNHLPIEGSGQTERWNDRTTSDTADQNTPGSGSTEPAPAGGGTVTMSWTLDVNQQSAIGAVALKPMADRPTLAELRSFRAESYQGKVLLSWQTGYEIDNLGFHLYRDEGGQLTRITPSVVAGSALFAGPGTALTAGRSYRWWDSGSSTAARYWLEDIDLSGKRTTHGPITPEIGETPESEDASAPLVSELGARRASLSLGSMAAEQRAGPPTGGGSNLLTQWAIAARPAVKLGIRHEGWYRIGQPELVAAGLDPMVPPNRLQLYVDGQEQPISVVGESDGRFDPQDAVEFYGTGLETPSTDTRIYWLVCGTRNGKRIATVRGLSTSPLSPRSFVFTVERKDRILYFAALRNGEAENFFGPAITTEPVQQSLSLQHLDSAPAGLARLELALQGATQGTHRVGVWLNGVGLTTVTFEGQTLRQVSLPVSQTQLQEGANWVTLAAQNGEGDVSLLDFIRLSYWHTFSADGDLLRFSASGGQQITVDGFSSPTIRVLDITSPTSAAWIEAGVQAQGSGYAVTFTAPQRGSRVLLAFTDAGVGAPPLVLANQPSDWNQSLSNVDLIMIAQRQFVDSLVPLKALREGQGWSVALVDVEDAYDEFSFGAKSPWALRDLLSLPYASSRPPRYLLLVGDATMDPRNYLGMGDFDLVPTKLVDTALLETASDDWFGDFNGDGIPEMAVGRLAVRSVEQAATAVAKIVGYEQAG